MTMIDILRVENNNILIKSCVPFTKDESYTFRCRNVSIIFKVVECYSSGTDYIIEAHISKDTYNTLQSMQEYKALTTEYDSYQHTVEDTMMRLSAENVELSSKLDTMFTLMNVSNYLNQWISSESDSAKILSDLLLGLMGVNYASIYLTNTRGKLMLKSTNLNNVQHHKNIKEYNMYGTALKLTMFNSTKSFSEKDSVHGYLGCPIYIKTELKGYIYVEHIRSDYITDFHRRYITIIANQIATFLEAKRLYTEILDSANKDGLTGLYNRSFFMKRVQQDILSDKRNFAICMLDIDDFKKCNDTYGHVYGDDILKAVSNVYRTSLRRSDIVARYGGEEIICCLYGVKNINDIERRMDRLRDIVSQLRVAPEDCKVTISTGISLCTKDDNLSDTINRADKALYQAKRSGKNCVVVYNPQNQPIDEDNI